MPVALRHGLLMAGVAEGVRYLLRKPRRFGDFRCEADDLNGQLWKTAVRPSAKLVTGPNPRHSSWCRSG